jgi:hypothetical protein
LFVLATESNRWTALAGKVNHIASLESARCQSVDELLAFIARVLADIRDPDNSGDGATREKE